MENRIDGACEYIRSVVKLRPKLCVVLGSGLGGYADTVDGAQAVGYKDIDGFPRSTVKGHKGRLVFGGKHGADIVCMQGRFHCYEGYTAAETVIPLRALIRLGINKLLLTNAAGGINKSFSPGDIMVIRDHINFTFLNPLEGKNIDSFGPRFLDISRAYDGDLCLALEKAALEYGVRLKSGVYAMMKGPSFETPAEIKALRILGADAAGMSTVPEIIAAAHAGVKSAAISCITNMAAGIAKTPLSHDEVIKTGRMAAENMQKLIDGFIKYSAGQL
ncbi:MAG: purine-nucleoside phosphorylase [Christensenellales bacterium]